MVCMVCNFWERAEDCNKAREGVASLSYLYSGEHEIVSVFHCQQNKSLPAYCEALLVIYLVGCLYGCNM